MFAKHYRIRLLFNANKVYDRQVIAGIGEYLQASQCDWDIFLEEDFRSRLDDLEDWEGDGFIADFDDPAVERALTGSDKPIVAVGGSYQDDSRYPDLPYVATDNFALVERAYEHLRSKGLQRFAFYGLPEDPSNRWAQEREAAFRELLAQDQFEEHLDSNVYHGRCTAPETWSEAMSELSQWLQTLPQPIGIIAVTDARARHLLQSCDHLGIRVPDQTAIIGIDNEKMARYLNRVSLSSVGQGCHRMGYEAAGELHRLLEGRPSIRKQIMIGPSGVFERQSTDFKALEDPHVIQAMHYIRHHACRGVKVEQVVDYVGISRSNLEKRFLEERGHSIHVELHQTKFNRAKNLLQTTALSTTEIATICGYPSLQYMYTVFKKNLSQTPKEFRSTSKEDGDQPPEQVLPV